MPEGNVAGLGGLILLTTSVIVTGCVITRVTGLYEHWIPVALGIVIGWMAIASINK